MKAASLRANRALDEILSSDSFPEQAATRFHESGRMASSFKRIRVDVRKVKSWTDCPAPLHLLLVCVAGLGALDVVTAIHFGMVPDCR